MSYPKKHSQVINEWFERILTLEEGEEIWLPCSDKVHQGSLKTQFYSKRKEFAITEPKKAERLSFSPKLKDGKYWIVAYKKAIDPTLAYIKRAGADRPEEIRIKLNAVDPARAENLHNMVTDGIPIEEAKEIYDMTGEEIAHYESLVKDRELIAPQGEQS